MVQNQSALGGRKVHRTPNYQQTKIGRVTSITDYKKYGKIEVVFLDYGQPFPVWVVGSIEREPVTGDQVLVGYMEGRKDAPYMMGFVRNESYTSNFIEVAKDRIRIQLPVLEVGKKDGVAHNDVKEHLLNEGKLSQRAYVELTPEHAKLSFPTTKPHPPTTLTMTASDVKIYHPTGNIIVTSQGNLPSVKTTVL